MIPVNDLSRQAAHDRVALLAIADRVISSGWYMLGPELEHFEQAFAEFVGVSHVVGVGNGTDALELALRAVGVNAADEVIMAANAGGYGTCATLSIGAHPVFADVAGDTGLLDPVDVAARVSARTRAVIITHLYGQAADVARLRSLLPADIRIVEDCAQAHGARSGGRMVGSLGDIATFSFYPTKNLGAVGDGGAITTDDSAIAAQARSLRMYGWSSRYTVAEPHGRNSRLDELQAAFLTHRLESLTLRNDRRRAIAATYRQVNAHVFGRDDESYVAHLCVLVVNDRLSAREFLFERGVQTDVHYPIPDYRQPGWALADVALPTTDTLCASVMTVPCFPEMTEFEVDQVSSALAALGDYP